METATNLFNEIEAGNLLSIPPRHVIKMAKRGELPAIHLPGGDVRFDPRDLWKWVESRKKPGVAAEAAR